MRTISPQQIRPPVVRRKMTPDNPPSVSETQGLAAVQETSKSPSSLRTKPSQGPRTQVEMHGSKQGSKDRPKIQTPPELAHLLTDPPLPSVPTKYERPIRPSRDGTPTLGSREPSPIVQSNLSPFFNSYHRRQDSAGPKNSVGPTNASSDSIASLSSEVTRNRNHTARKVSSRNPSPANVPQLRPATPLEKKTDTLAKAPSDVQVTASDSEAEKPLLVGENSGKPSRFGFFSRRTKGEHVAALERPKREPRKGPMAGTGHEGYGRRPLRGHRVSVTSTDSYGRTPGADSTERPPSNRKSSFGSNSDESVMDEFLSERLSPVFIRGEGGSVKSDRTSWDLASNTSNQSTPQLSEGDSRRSSDDKPPLPPKSKARPFRSPSPLKGRLLGQKPPGPLVDNQSYAGKANGIGSLNVSGIKTPSKPNKRWNFFQRTHNTSKNDKEIAKPAPDLHQLPNQVGAHYAMIHDEERLDMDDIERMMQDTGGYSSVDEFDDPQMQTIPPLGVWSKPSNPFEGGNNLKEETHQSNSVSAENARRPTHSILLPSPPMLDRPFSPQDRLVKVAIQPERLQTKDAMKETDKPSDDPQTLQERLEPITNTSATAAAPSEPLSSLKVSPSDSPGRPSRLAQIGRIPQVISKRDRDRKLPAQSFSRPFATGQPRPNVNRRSRSDSVKQISPVTAKRESDHETKAAGLSDPGKESSGLSQVITAATSICAADVTNPPEFFSFPPRKNSELSYTSSSGNGSFPGQPFVFSPQASAGPTAEDVWNEYDDLIDDVISPVDEPASAKSALGEPFQYHAVSSIKEQATASIDDTNGEVPPSEVRSTDMFADPIRRSSTAPLTTPQIRQQRSSFLSALHSDGTRGSGLTELIKGYAERKVSLSEPKMGRLSVPSSTRPSSTATRFSLSPTVQSPASSSHSRSATATELSLPAPTTTKDGKRESEDMFEQANLRFGALMTSKWLSFGRVLFSPAHSEVKDGKDSRVLIIDGLGKDWSYYCALTYPNATIYNLGPTPTSTQSAAASAWQSLSNHRHIHHASISSPFPFPRGFFAAVVFRFPIATSEAAYRTALSECKRVLRPGGHLELSILDIDLLSMGNMARKAVRQIKMKMQAKQCDVCLKPKGDSTLRLLGMRGYEGINRCVVTVPATGIVDSAASSPTSSESGDQTLTKDGMSELKQHSKEKTNTSQAAKAKADARMSSNSFGDMLRSDSNTKSSSVGVTKMVARVGRWWWSSCFETPFLADSDTSQTIWDDPAFLQECEEQGTGFKLLICYAQKPNMAVRRTVSV